MHFTNDFPAVVVNKKSIYSTKSRKTKKCTATEYDSSY